LGKSKEENRKLKKEIVDKAEEIDQLNGKLRRQAEVG
jgi:hypothetical protein